MKKTVLWLCLLMCVLMLAGCGKKNDTSEQVTLKWVIRQAEQKDADKVEELVNQKLEKLLPNTKIEFVWEPSVAEKWSKWMSAGVEYDLCCMDYKVDMVSEYENDAFMDLTDLIDEYAPNIQKEMKELKTAYESGMVDGRVYMIPNEQPIIHQSAYININDEFWDYFPVDEFLKECHENSKTTEKVYQLYEQYLLDITKAGLVQPGSCSIEVATFFEAMATRGYAFVITERTGAWLCYDAFDPNAKIMSFMQTDAYQLYIKYAARWAEMGYISEDYLATGTVTGTSVGSGNIGENWYGIEDERGVRIKKDQEGNIYQYVLLLDHPDNSFVGTNMFGSEKTYHVIPYTSENPERTIMFLDLLKSDEGEELLNLIVYGIEGEHYTKEQSKDGDYVAHGNGYILQPDSNDAYGIPHWMVANVFDCYRTPNILDGQKEWAWDYIQNFEKTAHKSKYAGLRVDASDLRSYIAQASNVIAEYHESLMCGGLGSANYEKTYQEFMKKLEVAGINDLIKKIEEQVQE